MKNKLPNKAKLFVRWGRKAAGLLRRKMAELPKDELPVGLLFCFNNYLANVTA